jgi:superfamily I DNA/RNA helicase
MSQSKHSDIIVVGDDFQAIYAWRGAVSALSRIQAETLYLTQSFRFGQAVADVANGILSRYFALPKRMQGTGQTEVGYVDTRKRHTIVSRTNSHLFKRASELCQHARLHIAGSNGNGELPIFGTLMDIYHLWRNQKFEIRDPEVKCFESYEQAKSLAESEMLDHEYAVALRIVEEFGTTIPKRIEDIKAAMEYDPGQSDVYLTTTHKAKGGEWDRVIVADDFPKLFDKNGNLIPLGFDEGQLDPQEINLIYVAATRAKQQLQINPDIRRLIGGVGNHGFDRPGRGESQAGTGGSESSNGLNEK